MPNIANWVFATADGSLRSDARLLYGFVLTAGPTAGADVVIRDGTNATSDIVIPKISVGTAASLPVMHTATPHQLKNGLYVDLTGTGMNVAVLIS